MKAGPECFECLKRLAHQAIELATSDPDLKSEAWREANRILERFSTDLIPTEISNELHRAIKRITKNPDPYRERKTKEIEIAKKLYQNLRNVYGKGFRSGVELAALGNAADFFVEEDELERITRAKPKFSIDHVKMVEEKLKSIREVLYLADNAGEVFFDLPLFKELRKYAEVTYVVKASPVQNDLAFEDLRRLGINREFGRVITTGTDTVGIEIEKASDDFRAEFGRADLVVAKGMGYYETLSELSPEGKVFYIFRAKCRPVARSLNVDINDYIAMLE